VKDARRDLVLEAKARGNEVIFDPVDLHCYDGRKCPFADLVDTLIVPNRACEAYYRPLYPKAGFAVIPHQWDHRLKVQAPQDTLRAAYIGNPFNRPKEWTGERVTDLEKMLDAAPRYNLHIGLNQRQETHILLKPSLKVSTAAAVGANVVSYPDPGVLELVGTDYPFLVRDDPAEAILEAEASFGSVAWRRGLATMGDVRQRTSIEAVAALYERLEQGEKRQAA
jgi:hypothetical protein